MNRIQYYCKDSPELIKFFEKCKDLVLSKRIIIKIAPINFAKFDFSKFLELKEELIKQLEMLERENIHIKVFDNTTILF